MVSSLKLRAIMFPFQMEPWCEELLHELGVRAKLSNTPDHCIMRACRSPSHAGDVGRDRGGGG
jgi:hypothetical protein